MSVDSTLRKAQKLAKAGDRNGAAALLRQVLAKHPGNLTAKQGLAALARQAPAGTAARARPAGGPQPAPRAVQAVDAMLRRGDIARAVAEAQRLALLFPNAAPVFNLLGIGLSRAGRMREAATAFGHLVALNPKIAGAHLNQANALFGAGEAEAAVEAAAHALRCDPKLFPAANLRGVALARGGRFDEADAAFRQAIRIAPNQLEGHLGLGNVLTATRRPAEALAAYEAARALAPANPEPLNNIGATLIGLGRWNEAVDMLGRAVEAHPRHRMLRTNLAKALRDMGRQEQALEHVEVAAGLGPANADILRLKGACLREMGEIDAAKAAFDAALEIDPDNVNLLTPRWRIEPVPLDHPDHARMATALDNLALPARNRTDLAFALFAAHDAAGDFDAAAGYLAEGNAIRRASHPYDMDAKARRMEALKTVFERAVPGLEPTDVADIPARHRVVFIVGMPRSGTSLVEQILASHSAVHGAGELNLLEAAMREIGWGSGQIGDAPDRDSLRKLRRSYLAGIDRLGIDAPVFTDKLPLNFRYVGHALAALPEARVLYLRRDARAVCWSNWAHNFRGGANDFGTDMGELARMYRIHLEMMEVYRAGYPDRIADVPYERLTENQEAESRKLVQAAGLDWEPACLAFHETKRVVRTLSAGQVRKGMYTGSSEAWRRYEAHLAPLLSALDGIE